MTRQHALTLLFAGILISTPAQKIFAQNQDNSPQDNPPQSNPPQVIQPQGPTQYPSVPQANLGSVRNNGNYVGAPLNAFNSKSLQGEWVSGCMKFTNAPDANLYSMAGYKFEGNSVIFQIYNYRDYLCQEPWGSLHKEIGTWTSDGPIPSFPLAGEVTLLFRRCEGYGCQPTDPNYVYRTQVSVIRFISNRMEFGYRTRNGNFEFVTDQPLFMSGTEPSALPNAP